MKKVQGYTEYQTSTENTNSSKTQSSEQLMEEPREYEVSINADGNYEASRYNSKCKMKVTLEFLGTGDSKEISDNILGILKKNFIEKNFKNYVDGEGNTRYTPAPVMREGGKEV